MLVLLVVFSAIALCSDAAWGVLAGIARQWFTRSPRRLEATVGLGGICIMGLGIRLAISGRHD